MNVDELLAKAKKPSADALKLHPFYRGKIETTLKCTVHSFNDFAIWYTPGVAAPCKAIEAEYILEMPEFAGDKERLVAPAVITHIYR